VQKYSNQSDHAFTIKDQLISWRRDFHMHPELGFREFRTAEIVAKVLIEIGYRVRTGVGKTGVVGELGSGSPVLAIRADMDALPIDEANQVSYKSQNPGVMHACGHDAHTAILLGVATLLKDEKFPGTVRLLFQPSEEWGDEENLGGATRMIRDGAMDGVDAALALHVDTHILSGTIGISAGPSSGGSDSFRGRIMGKGAHGARPFESIDPFFLLFQVTNYINGIVSRRINPFDPAVISIGMIHGGQAKNVIPDYVDMGGTIRFTSPDVEKNIQVELEKAFNIARSLGGDYSLNIEIGDRPVINDPRMVELIRSAASDLLGSDHVLPSIPSLGAEDFSVLVKKAPGAMLRLGCQIVDSQRQAHNPKFDIDESCLHIGAEVLAETALRFLRNNGYPV
jgi:amidohydrolase